ncbi:MAG: hypothetical protein ACLTMH_16670 [Faecalimonas umbilicata]|uniref:hypothetical protein n=1 Tax=Faecalimonas umbilicata TaxID=1912855 RepID=UPI00399396A3
MLKMVDGTGIIGVDMICPLGVSTPQPPNYDRVELEGTGILVLPNSLDAPLERLGLGGKTEQVQTSGKNLVNANVYEQGYLTSVNAGDKVSLTQMQKSFTTNMEVSSMQGKNVSVSVRTKEKTGKKYVFTDETDTIITGVFDTGNNNYSEFKNITIPQNAKKLFFSVTYDAQENTELQVELGTTVTTYEPYTGGKPSPSPEYPQEIKNSGKWNEETQKYEVDVKVTGKNLLNLQKEPDVKGTYQGWKVGNGELLTLGVKDKGNNADIKGCYIGFSDQGSESNGVVWVVDNGVIKANPLNQRKAYVSIFPANETTVKKLTERLDIQCELGNVTTPYQPYKEQTLTLTSDRPLTKWDRLVEQGGQIGWLYKSRIAEIPKTGYALKNTSENRYGVYFSKLSIFKDAVVTKGSPEKDSNIFTHFKLGNPYASNGNIAWLYVAGGNTDLRIKVEDETINTVELFEQYISDKDIKILYETESTEFVHFRKKSRTLSEH